MIEPHDKGFASKLEPETRGIFRTLVRAHIIFGIVGFVVGLVLYVVLYSVEGGGHTWPGGEDLPKRLLGVTTHEINATRLLWEFYVQHPRGPK